MEKKKEQKTEQQHVIYHVQATPEGKYWAITIPEINRSTSATSIPNIDEMSQDLIEIMTGEKNPEYTVELLGLPQEVQASFEAKHEAQLAHERAQKTQHEAILRLRSMGLSLRDIGRILGLSYQRVHQVLHA